MTTFMMMRLVGFYPDFADSSKKPDHGQGVFMLKRRKYCPEFKHDAIEQTSQSEVSFADMANA